MSAWVFGKLPAHGDFVARGVDAADRDALDTWLSGSLLAARDRYGEGFADRFDAAQPWRAEGEGVTGAIAASQDSAGRRYPVVLLCGGHAHDAAGCETLLYDAITQGWSVDQLTQAAGAAPHGTVARWYAADAELAGDRPQDLLTRMLA
jgi:type VI secretion system ImpM family protein